MALSKTTNTYNRLNWEQSVSAYSLKIPEFKFFVCQLSGVFVFLRVGISDSVSDMPWGQSVHENGES